MIRFFQKASLLVRPCAVTIQSRTSPPITLTAGMSQSVNQMRAIKLLLNSQNFEISKVPGSLKISPERTTNIAVRNRELIEKEYKYMNEKEYNKSLLIDKDGYLVLGSLEENEREMIAVIANLKADKIEGEYVEKSKLHSLKLHLKVFVAIFAWNIFGQIYYLTRVQNHEKFRKKAEKGRLIIN